MQLFEYDNNAVMERKISVLRSACLDFVSEQGIVA
ncbi:MAG: hypothetical protein ACI8WB_003943, partial [Phenylobacterium sp.]